MQLPLGTRPCRHEVHSQLHCLSMLSLAPCIAHVAPPSPAGIDPSDPASIQFLWHKGEDFMKAGACGVGSGGKQACWLHGLEWQASSQPAAGPFGCRPASPRYGASTGTARC